MIEFLPSQLPPRAVRFVIRSPSETKRAVVRFPKEEHNDVCYTNHGVLRG
jgi:hypothetical protein